MILTYPVKPRKKNDMRSCLVIGGLIRLQDKTRQECCVFINSDENIESVILMNRSKWKCIKKNRERERERKITFHEHRQWGQGWKGQGGHGRHRKRVD